MYRQWNKTYSCYGSMQTLTSPSNSVLCLTRTARARSLAHCPMVTSKSVLLQCLIVSQGPYYAPVLKFGSVQFGQRKVYMCSILSNKFPRCCFGNSSNVGRDYFDKYLSRPLMVDRQPLPTFLFLSSIPLFSRQLMVLCLWLCNNGSQAPQHLRSFEHARSCVASPAFQDS